MTDLNETAPSAAKIVISVEDIKAYLKQGVTRYDNSTGYNPAIGSIQGKYGLNTAEVKLLFRDPRLIGLKTVAPIETRIVILEDLPLEDASAITQEDRVEALSELGRMSVVHEEEDVPQMPEPEEEVNF